MYKSKPIFLLTLLEYLMIILFLSSCPDRGQLVDPQKYPELDYITGQGVSKVSIEDAEDQARSKVTEQLQSTFESESKSKVREWGEPGKIRTEVDFQSEIKIYSSVHHNQFIDIVNRSSKGSKHKATAVLNRQTYAGILLKELKQLSAECEGMLDQLEKMAKDQDIIGFNELYPTFITSFLKHEALAIQLLAVTRDHKLYGNQNLFDRSLKVKKESIRMESELRVVLLLESTESGFDTQLQTLEEFLVKGWSNSGLKIVDAEDFLNSETIESPADGCSKIKNLENRPVFFTLARLYPKIQISERQGYEGLREISYRLVVEGVQCSGLEKILNVTILVGFQKPTYDPNKSQEFSFLVVMERLKEKENSLVFRKL